MIRLKYIAIAFLFSVLLTARQAAFSQAKKPKTAAPVAKAAVAAKTIATSQDIEEGKMLISGSDCLACHHAENKMVGPPYITIARKYPLSEANVNLLSQKVASGGSGVWGEIPMPPHPDIAVADLKKIVKYILSLKPKS